MHRIRTSPRAFAVALLPQALLHGAVVGVGLASLLGSPPTIPAPDRILSLYLLRVALDGMLLVAGHYAARQFGLASRASYAAMGGIAAAIGYGTALVGGIWIIRPASDTVLIGAVVPALMGVLAGFLYGQIAGRETMSAAERAAAAAQTHNDPAALQVFNGPLQVRTSAAALALASLLPAVIMAVIGLLLMGLASDWTNGGLSRSASIIMIGVPAQVFFATLVTASLPTAIFLLSVHGIARAIGRIGALDYAIIGAITGLVLSGVLVFTEFRFFALPFALLGAMLSAVYRRFAGLEPLALPEAVLVRDNESLVPHDHPARRVHVVLRNG